MCTSTQVPSQRTHFTAPPPRLLQVSGEVDQSATMLSDEVKDKGYVLLCCAVPKGDLAVKVIEEEELLREVMV
jgi:hypothetical protein